MHRNCFFLEFYPKKEVELKSLLVWSRYKNLECYCNILENPRYTELFFSKHVNYSRSEKCIMVRIHLKSMPNGPFIKVSPRGENGRYNLN